MRSKVEPLEGALLIRDSQSPFIPSTQGDIYNREEGPHPTMLTP